MNNIPSPIRMQISNSQSNDLRISPNSQKQIGSYQLKEYPEWSLQMWEERTVTKANQVV